jgi:hypothetical protein
MWSSRQEQYRKQKSNSKSKGVPFRLTFAEWWKLWKDSGMYERRGPRGFVMRRINDSQPVEVGNVEIVSVADSFRETMEAHYGGEKNYL